MALHLIVQYSAENDNKKKSPHPEVSTHFSSLFRFYFAYSCVIVTLPVQHVCICTPRWERGSGNPGKEVFVYFRNPSEGLSQKILLTKLLVSRCGLTWGSEVGEVIYRIETNDKMHHRFEVHWKYPCSIHPPLRPPSHLRTSPPHQAAQYVLCPPNITCVGLLRIHGHVLS